MFLFIFSIVLLAAAVICFFFRKTDAVMPWATGALAVGAVICFLFSVLYSVGTKEEGIITAFGATTGHVGNGLHAKAPWEAVHTMDAAIQTDTYASESGTQGASASGPCIQTRIANQQVACVDVSIRWRIQPNSSDELYRDYRSFDHVRNSLVTRELKAAVNEQLATYNPLNSISVGTPASGSGNPSNGDLGRRIRSQMSAEIGAHIDVLSAIVSFIGFDAQTQARINQLQQQYALTRIAEQQYLTNQKKAAANRALATSVNTSPNVLVAQCMDILESMVKNNQSVPAGFSCWPGGGVKAVIAGPTGSTTGK